MAYNYITIKRDEVDFTPLMDKQSTITAVKKVRDSWGNGIRFVQYHVNNRYYPKIKITLNTYNASCSCFDFVLSKLPAYLKDEKNAKFCKHILAVIDILNQEEEAIYWQEEEK